MDNRSENFFEIPLNTQDKNDCSPEGIQPGWKGILVNAPRFIDSEKSVFPICGYYKLSIASLLNSEALTVHVHHVENNIKYTGFLIEEDENTDVPEPHSDIPEEDLSQHGNMAVGSYFNHNILDYVEMPFVSGTYEITIEYGNQTSNLAIVSVNREPAN